MGVSFLREKLTADFCLWPAIVFGELQYTRSIQYIYRIHRSLGAHWCIKGHAHTG